MRVSWLNWFAAEVLVVFVWGALASCALAKDPDTGTTSPGDDAATPAKKPAAKGGRDPLASAFKLPSGVTLNGRQKAAYEAAPRQTRGPNCSKRSTMFLKCPREWPPARPSRKSVNAGRKFAR